MNFLQALTVNPPLALKPDRPASCHLLSWQQFQIDEAADSVRKQRQQQLIFQTEQMAGALKERERNSAAQYEKYLQQLLLYQIQNDRLRQILKEWDSERKKYDEKNKQIDGAYQHKLELLKIDMAKSLEGKILQMADQNNRDLEQIRELYNRRLAQVALETNNYDDTIEKLRLELNHKNTKIQMLEASYEDVSLRLDIKSKQLKQKQMESSQLKADIKVIRDEEEIQRQQRFVQSERQKQEIFQLAAQNQELKDTLQILKGNIEEMRQQVSFAESQKMRSQNKKQQAVIRCLALEKQIEQFKFRKTQHHNLSDNRSVTGHKNSPHHSYKTLEVKMHEQEKLKDSRFVQMETKITQLSNRIQQLEDQVKVKEEQLSNAKAIIRGYEERIKDQTEQVNRDKIWAERIANLQKALKDLNQQWLTKQRQLGTLFKNIESNYMFKLDEKQRLLVDAQKALSAKQQQYQTLAITLTEKAMQLARIQQEQGKKK